MDIIVSSTPTDPSFSLSFSLSESKASYLVGDSSPHPYYNFILRPNVSSPKHHYKNIKKTLNKIQRSRVYGQKKLNHLNPFKIPYKALALN